MIRGWALVVRTCFAAMAASCSIIIMLALFFWAMTERLRLEGGWQGALAFSVFSLVASLIGISVLWVLLWLARRFRPVGRSTAAAMGAILFCIAPSVLLHPAAGLLTIPAGIISGLILRDVDAGIRTIGWPARIALLCGTLFWLFLLVMPALDAWRAKALAERPPTNSLLGERVMGGAALGAELWFFDWSGKTISLRLSDRRPALRMASGVAALAASGSTMWALLAPPYDTSSGHQPASRFRLAAYAGGRWAYSPWQDYAVDEKPMALAIGPQGPIVLAPTRLYVAQPGAKGFMTRALTKPIEPWGQFVTAMVGGTMYVGANRGEWGGGLLRIDLATGKVTPIERRDDKELCSGPLNGACDPVTGLVPDVDRPGCVFASVGLSHMMWHGRVLRVCGDSVEVVFEAKVLPIGQRIERALSSSARKFPPQTEPVFALAPAPAGFWAVTPRALYRWSHGETERQSFPTLETTHGLAMSDSIPGIVVVTTDANAAVSLSGTTPLIFATEERRR